MGAIALCLLLPHLAGAKTMDTHDTTLVADVRVTCDRARLAERNGDLENALSLWFLAFNDYQSRLRQYPEAFTCANRIETLAGQVSSAKCPLIHSYYAAIAELYWEFGDYENAYYLLTYVIDHPREAEAVGALAQAYYWLGVVYADQGELTQACDMFEAGIGRRFLTGKQGSPPAAWEQRCVGGLGYALLARGEYGRAIDLLRQASTRLDSLGEYKAAGELEVFLSYCYAKTNRPDSARYFIAEAKARYQRAVPLRLRWAMLHFAESHIEALAGHTDKAYDLMLTTYAAWRERKSGLMPTHIAHVRRSPLPVSPPATNSGPPPGNSVWKVWGAALLVALLLSLLLTGFFLRILKRRLIATLKARHQQEGEVEPMALPTDKAKEEALYQFVVDYVQGEQAYLSPTFSLEELCRALGKERKVVSQCINHVGGRNFCSFINSYRIACAIRLMQDGAGPKLSMDAIAIDSGFASRSTMWRAFRKEFGVGPIEYVNGEVAI